MYFTDTHDWIQMDGEIGKVGITKYAQKELGEIVYIELPEVGRVVEKGEQIAILESTKSAADIYAPVSGRVIEVHEAIKTDPSFVNMSPEGEGWLYKIEPTNVEELKTLALRA